ncbi:MAG TPA: hypothetical protein VJT69_00530 [Pyrinomonadaceae bacterium]|nr:hypothetical protein [Pyrinomonadaceae bacterium]
MKTLISAILLIVALSASGAALQERRPLPSVPSTVETTAGAEQPGEELREEFHQTYPLSATGRVSLENLNGGVQIKVWDRSAVQVDAIKRAYRRERLAEAKIEVSTTEENIRIKTEYPDENQNFRGGEGRYNNPATVDYTLTVPRKAVLESIELINGAIDIDGVEGNVKASSINGNVTAKGLAGEARLSTINGPLQVTFTQLDETKPIQLGSVNGNVTLIIPSNANASIRAGTVHGAISTDFGLKVKHGEYVGHSLDGQIGTGGPRIKLGNVNGAIRISHAQDGLPVNPGTSIESDAKNADGDADEDVDVDVKIPQVRTRVDTVKIAREAQRQVNQSIREAQREMERAQQQLIREQARAQRVVVSRSRTEVDNDRVTAKESRSFAVSGSPRVTINTFDGQVTIRGWDKPEVMYNATKGAPDENSLKDITIQAQQMGSAITITANNNDQQYGSVSFDVYVPRQSGLHVSSGDGALNLDGVSGQITLRSGDGPIEVANGGGQLQVNTGDGVIRVIKFEGQVDARTGDGEIALDGNFNSLSARTGDGQISLTVPAGSSFTIETNAPDEISNEGFNVAEDITPSPRVKRWRIGNGGKIFVLKTGDGKILLRPRQ